MDLGDQGLDIDILSDEDALNQNGNPVDADFDICFSADDVHDETSDDLPAGLLTALKKDAAEAAQAAAKKRKLEGNSAPSPSTAALSTAHEELPTAHLTVSAEDQTIPAAHHGVSAVYQEVPAAHMGISAVYEEDPAEDQPIPAAHMGVSAVYKEDPAEDQPIPASHKGVSAVYEEDPAEDQPIPAAHMGISAVYKEDPAENQGIPASHMGISAVFEEGSAEDQPIPASHKGVSAVYEKDPAAHKEVPAAHKEVPAAHKEVPAAHQEVPAAPALNPVAFSADPASYSPTADSTPTVPNTAAVLDPDSSCLTPQMPGGAPLKDLIPSVIGGADIKDLLFDNGISLEDDEWSCVETELIVPGERKPSDIYTAEEAAVVRAEPVISFEEALEHFKAADMSEIKPKIHQTIERHGISAWAYYFFGPPKLRNNLLPSKELTFCMAATPFDNRNPVHVRSLLALHRNLTGALNDCRRFGNHWETIGFQGNDPSTDLRGVGLFGLLQLLYLTSRPELETLNKQIYTLSNHNTQNFPFCVMGLNLSKLVLQTLREDKLNRLCNKREDLVSVVNDAFVATYFKVFHIWKSQNKTIVDSGFVIKDVENQLRKSPQNLIKELEEYLKNPNAAAAAPKRSSSKSSEKLDDFVGIADICDK